jgi:hypothetical protein
MMHRFVRRSLFVAASLTLGAFTYGGTAAADSRPIPTAGADLHIHNHTGTNVELYIFEDDKVHRDRSGGNHSGDLKDGETGTAHVKACHFAVVLFHEKDAYHAEFHDCSITDITITAANKK